MKIITRQSLLALKQSEITKELLASHQIACEFLPMETKGDNPAYPFFTGKGMFVKELQERLLKGEGDIAVHSLKDLPVIQAANLALLALLPRAGKQDVLIVSPNVLEESGLNKISAEQRTQMSFKELKSYLHTSRTFRTEKMGTSSLRRKLIFERYFETQTAPLRGNVGTRLKKVRNNEYSCTFLAKAGLDRIDLYSQSASDMFVLDPKVFVPSAAQGIIAVEACTSSANYDAIVQACQKITSISACIEAGFERLILFLLESDCYTPAGVYFDKNTLFVITEKDAKFLHCEISVSAQDLKFVHELLKKNNNIYASFFYELCESHIAQSIRVVLAKHNFF